jgi:16S rRNA (guanine527-N7)-methyltransferase
LQSSQRVPSDLPPIDVAERRLLEYASLLLRWNAAFNFVGRADVHRLVPRHLVDALRLVPFVRGPSLLDIGSGAGLPGVVLAVVCPLLKVTLLERTARRARFLEQTRLQLKLDNVTVVNADANHWRAPSGFASVTARAVASGEALGEMVRPHLAPDGVLVAQFGARQDERHLPTGFSVLETHDYRLPDNPADYRLQVLQPHAPAQQARARG